MLKKTKSNFDDFKITQKQINFIKSTRLKFCRNLIDFDGNLIKQPSPIGVCKKTRLDKVISSKQFHSQDVEKLVLGILEFGIGQFRKISQKYLKQWYLGY